MKYNKSIMIYLVISMMGGIYAQDNIINEIAKGGKFIVRDVEQNEAMVIEDGNVGFSGTLKLGILPIGDISNSIVVWDPDDKLLKLQDQGLSNGLTNNFKDEGWHTLGYDGLSDDNTGIISASVQNSTFWTESGSNIYRIDGNIGIGTSAPSAKLHVDGDIKVGEDDAIYWDNAFNPRAGLVKQKYFAPEIRYSSAIDFNVRRVSAGELDVPASSNIVFTFDSGGNIGIGTSTPRTKLDVVGQVKIRGGSPGSGKVLTSDATGLATWQTPSAGGGSTFWTESGSNIYRIDGNIGIGTSAPSAKFDVVGQVKIRGGSPGSGKVLTSDATGLATWQTPSAGGGSTFWIESGSNIYRIDGNIGIGTSAPSAKLHVDGDIKVGEDDAIYWDNAFNPRAGLVKQKYFAPEIRYSSAIDFNVRRVSAGKLDAPASSNIVFTFDSGGNIGIGTSTPRTKLDVVGQVKIRGGTPGLGKVLTSDATGLATWQTPAAGGGSTLWTESGSNLYRTSGNIGIGTTNPSAKLDVNGTVSAKRYVIDGLYDITNGVWDLSRGNLAQVTYNSSITPITINSDGSAGSYILVVKKNNSCTDCNMNFSGADVKYPGGVNPTLSSGSNTTDIFSFIAVDNNTFYCFYAKNLQ